MENHQAFDFSPSQELVAKTSSTLFSNGTKGGGDERTPVSLSGFGWIGAGHGMTCAVNVTGEHGLTYANVGDIYKDKDNKEWVLLRVTEVKSGSVMVPSLVFISKNLKSGRNDTNPAFETMTEAHLGTDLVNVNDANNKVTINKYSNSSWLKPAYNMTKQDVYVVNDGEKTLVQADGVVSEGDYVLVEETYTIMNPAHVAQAIIDGKPEGGYTENPNLAVGKELVTFDLQQIYNADGTVIHNWETTYHQDVSLGEFGGIQYGKKGDFVYLPGTKPFIMNSSVTINNVKEDKTNVAFDFTNLFDTTKAYPNGYATTETFADLSNVPHRRLDFNKSGSTFDKAFAGGQLPVFDGAPEERVKNTDRAFYFWNTRKAYHFSVGGSKADAGINKKYPDMTNATMKGSAYKKWIQDFDANGTASYYSVPYFSDGDNSRYFYFDLYQPGVTKKYDISAYLGTYSISKLEQSATLEYSIDYETGILTVSSLENNQTSADYLVLKAKYVGESVPAVEMKLRALPTLYSEAINDKLTEIAELMESVGAPESDYAPELIEKYKSLLAQKEAYEQAIKDEAANADRVAGLDNRYEYVDMKFVYDLFATENDRNDPNWKKDSTAAEPNSLAYKGFVSGMTTKYPSKSNVKAFYTEKIVENPAFTKDKNQNDIFTIGAVPFKLGKIARNDGEVGANAWIGRAEFAPELFNDESKLPAFDASVHGTINTQTAKATYQIDKDGISEVNILSSVNSSLSSAKFIDVNVKYENENKARTYKYIIGRAIESFEDTIWAIEKDKFEELASNPNYTAGMVKGTEDGSSGWTYKVKDDAYYAVQKATKYYQLKNNAEDYPIVKLSTLMDVDLSKISDRNPSVEIVFPSTSAKFVRSTDMTNHYVHNVKIPVDSTKTIETVQLHSNIEHPDAYITESGGFFDRGDRNVSQGALRINYDGKETVKIGEKEYIIFFDLYRECQESAFFGMTLTNAETWLDRIASVEAKMLALDAQTATYADVEALRAEIAELLAQNSNIVYVKDFSAEARANIDNVEEALKAAAEEAERIENLKYKKTTYISLEEKADTDMFAAYSDITEYARFSKSISGATSNHFGTTTYNGARVFDFLPATTSKDAAITGIEGYYYKGVLPKVSIISKNTIPSYVMLADDLLAADGTTLKGNRYKVDAYATPKVIYDEGKTRTAANRSVGVRATHVVERPVEDGKQYAIIESNNIKHKIGPIDGSEYSANSVYLSNSDPTIPVGKAGNTLSLLVGTNNFATSGYTVEDTAVGTAPKASLHKVQVNYANGDDATKYFVVTNTIQNKNVSDTELTIVYAPKKDNWTAADLYGSAKTSAKVLNNANSAEHGIADVSALKPEDIVFDNPDIMMTQSAKVATWINNRQDSCAGEYGQRVAMANIPLADEEVTSFTMKKFFNYIEEEIPTAIPVGSSTSQVRQAFVPVTVKGANDNYDYFAWVCATTDYSVLFGATIIDDAPINKIKDIEAKMATASTTADVEKIETLIANLTADGSVVYPKDFNKEIVDAYETLKETIDVSAEVEVVREDSKVTVKAKINNATGMEGKKFTVVVTFRDSQNTLRTKAYPFETKGEKKYTQNVVISNVPEEVTEIKAFVWKDLITLKPLTK